MKIDPSRIERKLNVAFDTPIGTRMAVRAPGEEVRLWSVFAGMEKNRYILLRLIREMRPIASPGNRLTVEYVNEHLIFGFSTAVIASITQPFPLLFLDYPETVECLDLRQYDRAICFLPATLYWQGEEYPGHILDISSGGCRIAVPPETAAPLAGLSENSSLFCQFSLTGPENIYAKCSIRSVNQSEKNLFFGVKFLELSEEDSLFLADYTSRINELRSDG